jgi:hypothetical protein
MDGNDDHIEANLSEFGKLLVKRFDSALDQLARRMTAPSHEMNLNFQKFLASLSPEDRLMCVAQEALETFLHGFLVAIEENQKFKLVAMEEDGTFQVLADDGTEGLFATQMNWRDEFSKYRSVEDCIDEFVGSTI